MLFLLLAMILAPGVVRVQRVVEREHDEHAPFAGVKPLQRPSGYG
jgi:hypothetical protein